MKLNKKIAATVTGLGIAALMLAGCSGESDAYQARKASQAETQLDGPGQEALNLQKKTTRENDPTAISYIYIINFGQIVGYYTVLGKVSSNGSQAGPEDEIVQPWAGGERYVVDSAQDDGSYGSGDPGIFFFTTDDVKVVTDLNYLQSDAPLAIDVPRLG